MTGFRHRTCSLPRTPFAAYSYSARSFAVAAGMLLLTVAATAAQQAPAPPQPQQAPAPAAAEPPPPAATPANRPGFLDALGRWVEDSATAAKSGLDSVGTAIGGLGGQAGGAAKGAADAATGVAVGAAQGVSNAASGAAKGAADAVTRLPGTRFANGRERCTMAPNGAPDCRAAAEAICKAAGYGGGSSADMQAAEKCPARVYLTGHKSPNDCSMEYHVTRAVCQ